MLGPMTIGAVSSGAGAESSLLTDLIAYWNLDEESAGSSAVPRADSVGSLTLTDVGTTASTTGIVGNAADFVAANSENLQNTSASLLDITANISFEINMWIYLNSSMTGHNILHTGSTTNFEIWCYLTNNKPSLRVNGVTPNLEQPAGLSALSTATWYNISFFYDQPGGMTGIRVNDDDNEYVTAAVTGTPTAVGDLLAITSASHGRAFFNGRMDEIGFWKGRVLTAAERTERYNGGSGNTYPFA